MRLAISILCDQWCWDSILIAYRLPSAGSNVKSSCVTLFLNTMGMAWPIVTVKIFECGLTVDSLSECSGRWAFPLYLLMTILFIFHHYTKGRHESFL